MKTLFNCIAILIILISCTPSPKFKRGGKAKAPPKKEEVLANRPGVSDVQVGIASYYGEEFHGKPTASGEIFDMHKQSAAHRTYPLGTRARVTNLQNGKSVVVKINDRGPFVSGRIMDLSYGAAQALGFVDQGTARVKIEVLEWGKK